MSRALYSVALGLNLFAVQAIAVEAQPRIVGGCKAESGHSWIVSLARKQDSNMDSQNDRSFCGGTLIHKHWVLTAAHCVVQNGTTTAADALEAIVGVTILDSGQGSAIAISEIIPHPQYDSANNLNDVALLRLTSDTTETLARLATIKPTANTTGENLKALVAGWGNTIAQPVNGEGESRYLPELREVNVDILDSSKCESYNIGDNQICAGILAGGKDSCQGDSGGPLVLKSLDQDTLVGVVSYGSGCAVENTPAIYASVAHYRDWIASNTGNEVPSPTAISENYSDFAACGAATTAPTDSGTTTAGNTTTDTGTTDTSAANSTSGGGGAAAGIVLLLLPFLTAIRRRFRYNPQS